MAEELGECTYCFRVGRARNLMVLLEEGKPHLVLFYCPDCYPEVRKGLEEYGRSLGSYRLPSFYTFITYPEYKQRSSHST